MSVDQQLDTASAGLTENLPGMNIFGAGRSTMAVLPEMMQLGQIMRMRADQTKDAYAIRSLDRSEKAAFAEADQFGLFQEHVRNTAGMDPNAQAKANRDFFSNNPAALTNRFIKDSLATQEAVNSSLLRTRQEELASKQTEAAFLDFEENEKTRVVRAETATINASTALAKAKADAAGFQAMMDNGDFEQADKLGEAIGRTGGLDQDVKENIGVLGGWLSQNPSSKGLASGLAGIASSFSKANSIAESYGSELSEHAPLIKYLGENSINIRPDQTPEELSAAFAQARKLADNSPDPLNSRLMIDNLEASTVKLNGFISQAKLMESAFRDDLAKVMEGGDTPETQAKARDMIMRWRMKSSTFNGLLNQKLEQDSLRLENRKKQLEIDAKLNSIMNSDKRLSIAEKALALRREGIRVAANLNEQDQLMEFLKIVMKEEESKTKSPDKLAQEAKALRDAFYAASSFEGTTEINLKD